MRKFFFLLMLSATMATMAQQPAFPGAEGFGMYTTGGRGGKVYHVTNLDDSGTGSLRWANSQSGPRTIVFDVSGTIHLKSALKINGNTTIAGQTAPGDGICCADYPVSINGNNVIIRFMRFRLGNENVTVNGADGWDGFGALDRKNLIIDHCSVCWSIDECLSFCGVSNSTVQWCIASQSLRHAGHTKGNHGYGGNWGGAGSSFHHNLMMHHESRTPRLGPRYTTQLDERMDMRNNVIFNWTGNGCYGGEAMTVNIVNNYYKPGPGTPTGTKGKRIAAVNLRTTSYVNQYTDYKPTEHIWGDYYVDGNVNAKYADVTADNWTYGMYNQIVKSDNDGLYDDVVKDTIRMRTPMPFLPTTTHSAEVAYEKVLLFAGASLHRDSYDALMISDCRDGVATYTGDYYEKTATTPTAGKKNAAGVINSPYDNKPAGAGDDWSPFPELKSEPAPADTDGDGMPDTWETANGLNPNDAADGNIVASDGYTNLEHYLNSIVADITAAELADGVVLYNNGIPTAIKEISRETTNTNQDNNIYSLSGVLLIKEASTNDLSLLSSGIYIMNHKKFIVK